MRQLWADNLKGILILLVILGHSIQYRIGESCFDNMLWNIIYSFHMPCFFALSGLFARKVWGGYLSYIWRRVRQLLIPMILWQFIYNCSSGFSVDIWDLFSYLDCGTYWFLWTLFFVFLIWIASSFLSKIAKVPFILTNLFFIATLFCIMVVLNYREHGFQYIAFYYPFYVIGYYIPRLLNRNLSVYLLLSVAALWFIGSLYWNMHTVPTFLSFLTSVPSSLVNVTYRYLIGFLAILSFLGLTKRYFNKTSKIGRIGELTLGIYTIHLVLLKISTPYINALSISNDIAILSSFVCVSIITVILVMLINKYDFLSISLLGKIK